MKKPGTDASCGPKGNVDCCDIINVPGGTFDRVNDGNSPATVSSFWLDRYEMTVARLRALMSSLPTQANPPQTDTGARPGVPGSGWDSSLDMYLPADPQARQMAYENGVNCVIPNYTPFPGSNEHQPANCVPWYDAFLLCIADGGFLPTEAEWNYAAAGGNEQRLYPWGMNPPDPTMATFMAGMTTDVGSHSPQGDGKWGHADLAGNVREWTLDFNGSLPLPCNDCVNTLAAPKRVMRGGSFQDTVTSHLATTWRDPQLPNIGASTRGLRCVRF